MDDAVVDERMLNTVYAWIRKSDEDKLDGMVHILQHLLQCYAARELDNGETPLDVVIGAAASEWPAKFPAEGADFNIVAPSPQLVGHHTKYMWPVEMLQYVNGSAEIGWACE